MASRQTADLALEASEATSNGLDLCAASGLRTKVIGLALLDKANPDLAR